MTDTLHPMPLDISWISHALLLSQEAGWNQVAEDWAVFLTHGTVLGFVVEDRLVATAAALPYGDSLGWISMVLVTAEWRRKGLATRLTAACTSVLRDAGRAALLDAAPAAVAIYKELGFVPLETMERWEGPGGAQACVSASPDLTLDQYAFGADRRFLLDDFLSRADSLAFRADQGFAILRRGATTWQLGPVVAGPKAAPLLASQAVRAAPGRVIVDVLGTNNTMIPTLTALGFQPKRTFTRMALGLAELPGIPAQLPAAAGPEFG